MNAGKMLNEAMDNDVRVAINYHDSFGVSMTTAPVIVDRVDSDFVYFFRSDNSGRLASIWLDHIDAIYPEV